MKIQSEAVKQMTPLSIKPATNFFSPAAPGFISGKTCSNRNSTKPTLKPKDLKTMRVKPKASYKKFGVFFTGNLTATFFNRSGHIERCVLLF
jgi:hypothetical protein